MRRIAIYFGFVLILGIWSLNASSIAQSASSSIASNTTITVVYSINGEIHKFSHSLTKPPENDQEKITAILQEFIKGPTSTEQLKGIKSVVPAETKLDKIEIDKENNCVLYLQMSKEKLSNLTVLDVDNFHESLEKSLYGITSSGSVTVLVFDEAIGKYRILSSFLPPLPPVPKKPGQKESSSLQQTPPIDGTQGFPAGYGQGQPTGPLTGKTVFLSAGHGWYYVGGTFSSSTWNTQRGNTYSAGIVEDLSNVDAVNNYLVQYLWNAGANVWTCRARSRDTATFIVDYGDSGYSETGTWGTSSSYTAYYGTGYRYATPATYPTATATWRPTISTSGYYPVYVWYNAGSGSNRPSDIHYRIVHSGGTTEWIQNQTHDGSTWKWLGTYYFEAGTTGFVQVTNQATNTTGTYVIADAARFGDGFGSIQRGSVTSGQQKQDECSRYWAQFMGAPSSAYNPSSADNNDDVTCRPLYSLWEAESWEDPIFISWHTNAGGGSGTQTYIWDTSYVWGIATSEQLAYPGSFSLMTCVHNEILNDIRRAYDSSWVDSGKRHNDFGELRPLSENSATDGMPGILCEMAFHDDTTKEIPYLKDPNFRQIIARAVYQGIVKYFAKRDSLPINLLPEPPTSLRVVNTGSGSIQLTWCAPTTDSVNLYGGLATSYRVYRSTNGYGFDNGILSSSTTITISGLTPDRVYFFRVSAMNAGGESFPTNTLTARIRSSGKASILIVDGFDRMDRWMMPAIRSVSKYYGSDNGYPNRQYMELVNSYNYSIQHATAIANATTASSGKFYFDSANNESIASGLITLSNYTMVVWITGKESSSDETFSSSEQTQVTSFLNGGGRLFVSGAEIGWDLGRTSGSADSTFYSNSLKARYAGDDSNTDTVTISASGIFNGLSTFVFDTGRGVTYFVDYPDQLNTIGNSSVCLVYSGGSGGNAAVQYSNSTTKVVNFGFPFETILDSSARNSVMQRILLYLDNPFIVPIELIDFEAVLDNYYHSIK